MVSNQSALPKQTFSTGRSEGARPNNVAALLDRHVVFQTEGIDRVYINGYQSLLQRGGGVVEFFKKQRGMKIVGSSLLRALTEAFVADIKCFAKENNIDLVQFKREERKEDVAKKFLSTFGDREGVLFIGVEQEKSSTFRTNHKVNATTGFSYPWLYRSSVMCNQYYFYINDADFGRVFIKFSSYFPHAVRVCINGHEYAKQQLKKEHIDFAALENGFLSCRNPARLQQILDGMDAVKIEAMIQKWLARLPHPFTPEDQAAGYRYKFSILQAEFALTQIFDNPLSGRHFFEQVIRENLDLGRPENVSLIFDRRVNSRTPGIFRTRIVTQGVIPSLHVSYLNSKIKQYFKEGRGLRTETTINNTNDFGIRKTLNNDNLAALRQAGFKANRRLLNVQRVCHDCRIGEETFQQVTRPAIAGKQRAPALKFGDERVMALFSALCLFAHLPMGFANRDLRASVAALLGEDPAHYGPGRMTYDLRRLLLHGLIERKKGTNRYELTNLGLKVCMVFTKIYARVLKPACSDTTDAPVNAREKPVRNAIQSITDGVEALVRLANLSA